jgi:hypothetical protein
VFGASVLQIFTKFLPIIWFPNVKLIQWWSKIGPGLAGVGIARQPEGVIPQVGHDLREKRRLRDAEAAVKTAPEPAPAPTPAGEA